MGAKVTTKAAFLDDAVDALLMEISEMSSSTLNGIPMEAHQTQIYVSRNAKVDSTATDEDIEAELLNGLCQADADQFRADNRLGLKHNHTKEGNGT